MTQTGKCDTCRQRKVKCDEERPKCGACRKKDRPCTYSYGKASAFVVQDPNQLTKHGKSMVAPIVYALNSSSEKLDLSGSPTSDLRLTTERTAENGQGFFQTLTPISKPKARVSKKKEAYQRRALEIHLQKLQEESAILSIRPLSPETTLIARYINMLGSESLGRQPLSILGTWIQSIPSRIGSNRMLDLAVEFFINSHAVYRDNTYSKRKVARASKAQALKELQLVVSSSINAPSYEVLLATKMHYAAEALMGIETMYHAIHAYGLAELLKAGTVSNVDYEHYWNLIDNTYVDDVNEAMLARRNSVYDNEFYLSSTYPPAFEPDVISLTTAQRASMAIMHIFIQCPRLVNLIRKAIMNPRDPNALASAVSLAESLWELNLQRQVEQHLQTSITVESYPVEPEIADILHESLRFDSVQNMNLCTRYWTLQIVLGGLFDTLHRHFPSEIALSLLPTPEAMRMIEVDAALQIAKSVPWAESISQKLPLVPLRLHSPLQISIAPWHRIVRSSEFDHTVDPINTLEIDPRSTFELSRAKRMKEWLIEQCNRIHRQWYVATVEEKPLLEALDSMTGEKIPDWLPVRVRFEAEDGEMVIKLDYENRTGNYQETYELGDSAPKKLPNRVIQEGEGQGNNAGAQELPFRTADDGSTSDLWQPKDNNTNPASSWSSTMRPADFIHATGRGLCSTSGWWPDTPNTARILIDSTHKVSAFSKLPPQHSTLRPEAPLEDSDGLVSLASGSWSHSPATSTSFSATNETPESSGFSSDWSGATIEYVVTPIDETVQDAASRV